MLINASTQLPTKRTPAQDQDGTMSQTFWDFLRVIFDRTGQGAGVIEQVQTGVVAAGLTQATATQLPTSDVCEIDQGNVNNGVMLVTLATGQVQEVFNNTGNNIFVYPQVGVQIDVLAVNAGYFLATGKMQRFRAYSATKIRSMQLG